MDHLVDGTTCAMASIFIKENIGYLNSPVEVFYKKIYYTSNVFTWVGEVYMHNDK